MNNEVSLPEAPLPSVRPNRRSLLRNVGIGAAGIAAMSGLAAAGVGGLALSSPSAQAGTLNDPNILNFALNLEYLEANYYLLAATGAGLGTGDQSGTGTQGTVTGGSKVPFTSGMLEQYANNIAADEQTHVRFLRASLGASAVAMPNIDLSVTTWTNLAVAAGLISSGQTFNPFADEASFLLGAYVFEDVGVTAYNGALAAITDKGYLTAASSIMAVEAYHAATVRTLLGSMGAGAAAQKISDLRATLSLTGGSTGTPADDEGILMPSGAVNVGPFDIEALAFRRDPRQVLNIVYFTTDTTVHAGGFFPNGLNGNLT